MLPPVGIEPWPITNFLFQVQHSPFWAKWSFACKTDFRFLIYSHALLIPIKLSKSKNQVMHEQKFKEPLIP